MPVQLVDATPLWSFDLTIRFWGPIIWGRSSLLLKQKAFSLHLRSRMTLNHLNSWTWDFALVLRRPIEITQVIGNWHFCAQQSRFPVSKVAECKVYGLQPTEFLKYLIRSEAARQSF
jgi:hypothetical protein